MMQSQSNSLDLPSCLSMGEVCKDITRTVP